MGTLLRALNNNRSALIALFLLALPFIGHTVYQQYTAMPSHIAIATGPKQGRYKEVGTALAAAVEKRIGISVETVPADGSLHAYELLQDGEVDFALYQRGRHRFAPRKDEPGDADIRFVANMYSELTHLVVRGDTEIETVADLRGKRVAVGLPHWGEHEISALVLEHSGLDRKDVDVHELDYEQVQNAFDEGSIDAALMTAGVRAPALSKLLRGGRCRLGRIPHVEALTRSHVSLGQGKIPAGYYRSGTAPVPRGDRETIAVRAELLTREGVSTNLVQRIAELAMDERFTADHGLTELFDGGVRFARARPDFPIHSGAETAFDPSLEPLLDPDFVQATEGLRSFLVSMIIAVFLFLRWIKRRAAVSQEHKLDRYIKALLDIERQAELEQDGGASGDATRLRELLAEVTRLRQQALGDFTAHELNEERAAQTFIGMCHALSDKLHARILHQRIDAHLQALSGADA